LDLASVGPAARASGILADYGATVVKVLRPAARVGESIEAPESAYGGAGRATRVRIDLAQAAGRDAFLRLADRADVVLESFRPGVARRLGIDAAALRARNPRLVHCAITGYGSTGPYAAWAGHDLNYVGLAGMLGHGDARADGGPPVPGATVADAAGGGMHAAIAVLVALLARAGTGEGATLDVSATDGALWLMSLVIDQHLAATGDAGAMPLLSGAYGCYSTYRARDGRWLTVAALESRFWRNLCEALGAPDLAAAQTDPARQAEVKQRLAAVFATRDRDDWVALLGPADTCVAPVHTPREVAGDPQFRARGLFASLGADGGGHERLAPLLAGSRGDGTSSAPPPLDTDGLLRDAGLAAAEIATLRHAGIVA
jgi:alpha-methylacyl-CoA racemase